MADYKVTDTELTSVANAIRAKTGKAAQIEFPTEFVSEIDSISGGSGSGILSGTAVPTSSIGSDGDIYLQYAEGETDNYIDYIMLKVRESRSGGTAIMELRLYSELDGAYVWPSGIEATTVGFTTQPNEGIDKMFDNDVSSKCFTFSVASEASPLIYKAHLPNPVDLFIYNKWQLYSSDYDSRVPKVLTLYGSKDGETWYELDSANNIAAGITPVYTGDIKPLSGIIKAFLKKNGVWEDLIGSSIDDVN